MLNEHLFFSIDHARAIVAGWVEDFNTARPHSAIGYMTPAASGGTLKPQRASAPAPGERRRDAGYSLGQRRDDHRPHSQSAAGESCRGPPSRPAAISRALPLFRDTPPG